MTSTGRVVIVSEHDDIHAAAMTAVLKRDERITPVLLDLRSYPRLKGHFAVSAGLTSRSLQEIGALDDIRAIWWRRPHPCNVPPSLSRTDDEFRQAECDSFIQGFLWSIPALWVNDPRAERLAVRKLVQLDAAAHLGLAVPETLVTNDPARAADFIASRPGRVVYKRTGTSRAEFSETRLVEPQDLTRLSSIEASPTTFQDFVAAQADVRVAWIAGREFAVRIDSQAGAGWVDSRLDIEVNFITYRLPASVSRAVSLLMERLGLLFGVLDLRIALDGEFYFLEVNSQGQFAFMEIKTGLPIFAALASLLASGEHPDATPLEVAAEPAVIDAVGHARPRLLEAEPGAGVGVGEVPLECSWSVTSPDQESSR